MAIQLNRRRLVGVRCCIDNNLMAAIPTPAILPRYLLRFLETFPFMDLTTATTVPSIRKSELERIKVPVPPLDEQDRIVVIFESLLAKAILAKKRIARVRALSKNFRQAVLAAACSGKLTEDWRKAHSISEIQSRQLLSEILLMRRESAANGRKSYTPPAQPDGSVLGETPVEWEIVSMDALACRITSGSRDWKQYYREDGPGTFVMAQNVRPLSFDRSYRLAVAPPEDDSDATRSAIAQHDILVTIVGANTGDVCRVSEHIEKHYVCQSVALIRPVEARTSRFLELYLNSPSHGQAQFQEWIYGEGRPHLSFDHLRTAAIALPSIDEQDEIVRRVETLFMLADAIEKRVGAATLRAERLTQAILAKAFRGELVPTEAELARREGREYEPASVLLKRIREEREKAGAEKPLGPKARTGSKRQTAS
jgi:type I restriction enzyme S subunit